MSDEQPAGPKVVALDFLGNTKRVAEPVAPVSGPDPEPEQGTDPGASVGEPGAPDGDVPPRARDDGLPDGCPVSPLGVNGRLFFYLDALGQVKIYQDKDHGRLPVLALFGNRIEWIYSHRPWVRWKKAGDGDSIPDGVRPEKIAEDLMQACADRGVWDVATLVRGRGSWLGPNGELIMHCGDALASSARLPSPGGGFALRQPGQVGDNVYPRGPATPRPADEHAGPEAGLAMLELLAAWKWARGEVDARLILGWIVAAMLGGALKWRPLAWVTGEKGTGKSTLLDVVEGVLGAGSVKASDATAAGLWQALQLDSLPVILDEMESEEDNRQNNKVIKLAREAASGGITLRGGESHTGIRFTSRSCFMFSSIQIPPLLGQDVSRFFVGELGVLDTGAKMPAFTPASLAALGRAMRRRLLEQWHRWPDTLGWYRDALVELGHSNRSADQFGTLLAAGDLVLSDAVPEGHEDEWGEIVDALDAAKLSEMTNDAPSWQRWLSYLLSSTLDQYTSGARKTVGAYVAKVAREGDFGSFENQALMASGLQVKRGQSGEKFLAVAADHRGLAKLHEGSHWSGRAGADGGWNTPARRVPGAIWNQPGCRLRFDGSQLRCTLLPLASVLPEDDEHESAGGADDGR